MLVFPSFIPLITPEVLSTVAIVSSFDSYVIPSFLASVIKLNSDIAPSIVVSWFLAIWTWFVFTLITFEPTWTGVTELTFKPFPKLPFVLFPQAYTLPWLFATTTWLSPALARIISLIFAFFLGNTWSDVCSVPNTLFLLEPQAYTSPFSNTATL